jgi:thiol-disulfide isomerase/thioredoxin
MTRTILRIQVLISDFGFGIWLRPQAAEQPHHLRPCRANLHAVDREGEAMIRTLGGNLVLLAMQLAGLSAAAEPEPKNYVVFPITTDLQRELLFGTNADAYAQVDVAGCMHDNKFDLRRLDVDSFRKDLAALIQDHGPTSPKLLLNFRYVDVSLSPDETRRMEAEVANNCRRAGFAEVGMSRTMGGKAWQQMAAQFAVVHDEPGSKELSVEDQLIRVYPVQAKFSRYLLDNPDEDCFIQLRQPIDGRFDGFSPATIEEIGRLIARLKLPEKRRFVIRLRATTAGQESIGRYFRRRGPEPAPADAFVKTLGFQSANYSISPSAVNPEALLGRPAPDFTLEALGGGTIHLHDMIRGRVALISFWGVACGPCRAEAPYLSALYNRFRDQGLTVIAVNAYDEGKQEVDGFARANGLAHPIALMGRKVAEEQYTVTSYPVTFLVDRTGAIADYHLDFEPGDEKLLAKSIARLLAERQKTVKGK